MSSQLVDINADGYNDILAGSFSGTPQLILGAEDGFEDPEPIVDCEGEAVLIADFWNTEDKKWDKTDRAGTPGHCTSASAVDWDDDGDFDLLLGDYDGGNLFLRINEGSAAEPAFAETNTLIEAGGKPMTVKGGLAAPRIVDFNGDGLFDILCGGSKGGVYYFENVGETGKPEFAKIQTLIDPVKAAKNSFIRKVPSDADGQPLMPGSSYHIEPVDYDGDGDLDLLVGARCSWDLGDAPELTDKQKKQAAKVKKELKQVMVEISEMYKEADTDEAKKALRENKAYKKLTSKLNSLASEQGKLDVSPTKSGDFVWLFRRK